MENETGVHFARRAKRADKEPDCVEVRASIVAEKRGNARGEKGRRKIDRNRPVGRKKPSSVIGFARSRSVQGWRTLSREGSAEEHPPANPDSMLAGCHKRWSDTMENNLGVAEPRTHLFAQPGPTRYVSLTVDPIDWRAGCGKPACPVRREGRL